MADPNNDAINRSEDFPTMCMLYQAIFKLDYARLLKAGADPVKLAELLATRNQAAWEAEQVFARASKRAHKKAMATPEVKAYMAASPPVEESIARASLSVEEAAGDDARARASQHPKMIAFERARFNVLEYALRFSDMSFRAA